MQFDLDQRTVSLSAGEFSGFSLGPRESLAGTGAGIWRAQLGTHWHNELRQRATAEHATAAEFELPITGRIAHRGWTFTFNGRIDQVLRLPDRTVLREIKSVTHPLPADETELRRDHPDYFIQLATYAALTRLGLASIEPQIPALKSQIPDLRSQISDLKSQPSDLKSEISNLKSPPPFVAQLVFVEVAAGVLQTVALTSADEFLFRAQLDRVADFLDLRLRARTRLRGLRFQPAFATPRPGQESTQAELTALFSRHPLVLFEAPTGFGKTGVLLEFALGQLRSGHFDRALYLTSKSTGQLQVVRTLQQMTAPPVPPSSLSSPPPQPSPRAAPGVALWHVRNKAEHCVNTTFHCVRDNCLYLADAATRWPQSGLARFYLDEHHARDLDTLRAAGRDARICPYEITRAALAFNDVWVGDYNYVFAPRNRSLFGEQPGFVAARTLLIIDEAHNLPARVADACSHAVNATTAFAVRDDLHRVHAPTALVTAWDHWCHFLHQLRACDALPLADEDDARHLLAEIAKHLSAAHLDYAALGPHSSDALWSVPALLEDLSTPDPQPATSLPRLWWCPRDRELLLTCLDAAPRIGATLREFGGVVLASATLTPLEGFSAACGLTSSGLSTLNPQLSTPPPPARLGSLTKRDTAKLYRQLTTAADLLRVEEARDAAAPAHLHAHAPWRDATYDVAIDARVDTTFQHRSHHYPTTAATVAALCLAARQALSSSGAALDSRPATSGVAVFFPSYAYAEAIARDLATSQPSLRVALQPRVRDLAAQAAWVDESLLLADALFLVLGSSFAESIDMLGGRIEHALVVGPALPEVNAVQRARLAAVGAQLAAANAPLQREAAFRRVYQIPGMTKVNQALGRLVRAPGHRARVILHCRRFLDESYANLLAPEYRTATTLHSDADLAQWLARPRSDF